MELYGGFKEIITRDAMQVCHDNNLAFQTPSHLRPFFGKTPEAYLEEIGTHLSYRSFHKHRADPTMGYGRRKSNPDEVQKNRKQRDEVRHHDWKSSNENWRSDLNSFGGPIVVGNILSEDQRKILESCAKDVAAVDVKDGREPDFLCDKNDDTTTGQSRRLVSCPTPQLKLMGIPLPDSRKGLSKIHLCDHRRVHERYRGCNLKKMHQVYNEVQCTVKAKLQELKPDCIITPLEQEMLATPPGSGPQDPHQDSRWFACLLSPPLSPSFCQFLSRYRSLPHSDTHRPTQTHTHTHTHPY